MLRKLSTCFSSLGVGSTRSSQMDSPGMAAPERSSNRARPWGCGTKALSISVLAQPLAILLAGGEVVDQGKHLGCATSLGNTGAVFAVHVHHRHRGYGQGLRQLL